MIVDLKDGHHLLAYSFFVALARSGGRPVSFLNFIDLLAEIFAGRQVIDFILSKAIDLPEKPGTSQGPFPDIQRIFLHSSIAILFIISFDVVIVDDVVCSESRRRI